MTRTYTLTELAQIVEGALRDPDDGRTINGVADLSEAHPQHAAWVSNLKFAPKVASSRAGVVLVGKDFGPTPMPAIVCARVDRSVALLLAAFAPERALPSVGVHSAAVIDPTALIGANVRIGPHVVVESGVVIGESTALCAGVFVGRATTIGDCCTIWPNVVIRDGCIIGNRVEIHPNAVIGADGLGFYFYEGRHNKVPHIGGVRIGDDAEIGACTCIDRAKFGYTEIGSGTKIDNLVQIAHNVRVGDHCVFAAQAGFAGSTRIGNFCLFGGRAATTDNVSIGDGARFSGGIATASKDVAAGTTVAGCPAQELRAELRSRAVYRRLPEVAEQVRELIARVKRLEASTDHRT